MSIYLLETWVIKPEDEEEHRIIWRQYVNYMNENPELFSSIKSMKLCKKLSGDDVVTHAQMGEFDSLKDKENLDEGLSKDRENIEFHRKLMLVKDAATVTEILCEPFLEYS